MPIVINEIVITTNIEKGRSSAGQTSGGAGNIAVEDLVKEAVEKVMEILDEKNNADSMSLLKMTILSFKSFEKPADLMKPRLFMAMFNPSSYKVEFNLTKDKKEATGDVTQSTPVTAVSLKKMSFDFLIDGTGANGEQRVVLVETKKFESLVMPEKKDLLSFDSSLGNAHLKLPQLLLLWGTFMFPCEIESFSVNYTLFSQLGIPLRATISASFNEVIPKPKLDILDAFTNSETAESVSNIASFLSTAFSATNNVVKAVEMAREENLNSIRVTTTSR